MRGKKLTRRQKYLLRDCVLGTLIGFGAALIPVWQFDGPANFIITGISLSLIATYGVIGTNPVWNRKKKPDTVGAVCGQEKGTNIKRASVPSFYTIMEDKTI